jgi:hypothetical protein
MDHHLKKGAIDTTTGCTVLPGNASKKESYICPQCQSTVEFAKGRIVSPYFRHAKGDGKCACNESPEHLTAKFMLKDFLLSKKTTRVKFSVVRNCSTCTKPITFEIDNDDHEVREELWFVNSNGKKYRADLACVDPTEPTNISVIFEICHTNPTEFYKRPEPWFELSAQHVIDAITALDPSKGLVLTCMRQEFNAEKWDKCSECEQYAGTIYFNQRGAGCGKTYESIHLLHDARFHHKTTFIYLTKMRSAKKVIEEELTAQFAQRQFPGEYSLIRESEEGRKQYVAHVRDTGTEARPGRGEIKVVIGTIDAFTYALRVKSKVYQGSDMFKRIVCDILQGNVQLAPDGLITFAQPNLCLSDKCLIIIDEAQDLEREYIMAFQEITRKTNIDTWVIGDRLQSIFKEDNLFTYLNGLPETPQLQKDSPGKNVVMRFHNEQLKTFVNKVVPFAANGLPEIEGICTLPCCGYTHENDVCPYHVDFNMPFIWKCQDDEFIDHYIRKLLGDMREKVVRHGYLPKNFCFIFPSVSEKNQFIPPLYASLAEFWEEIFLEDTMYSEMLVQNMRKDASYWDSKILRRTDDTNFYNHVIHHSSENNGTIDLTESVNATRIMSIHASKGQGCECVYFLGINDRTLGVFSDHDVAESLVFESLLHVGLTRSKQYLWVGITGPEKGFPEGQMKRFEEFSKERIVKTAPMLKFRTSTNELAREICKFDKSDDASYLKLLNQQVDLERFREAYCVQQGRCKEVNIDWGHHVIRSAVMHSQVSLQFHSSCQAYGQGVFANFREIMRCELTKGTKNGYRTLLRDLNKTISDNITIHNQNKKNPHATQQESKPLRVPILSTGFRNADYQDISELVYKLAESVQQKLKNRNFHFCPFEAIMHHHLSELVQTPYNLNVHIMDIYKILSYYSQEPHGAEYGCPCQSKLKNVIVAHTAIHDKITSHHMTLSKIQQLTRSFFCQTGAVTTNDKLVYKFGLKHYTSDDKTNKSIEIGGQYNYYAEDEGGGAVAVYLSPQLNSLNYTELLARIVVDRHMWQREHTGKTLNVYIFTLDHDEPIKMEFLVAESLDLSVAVGQYLKIKYKKCYDEVFDYMETKPGLPWKVKDDQPCLRSEIQEKNFFLPFVLTNLFDTADEDEPNYVPDIVRDKAKLIARTNSKIDRMFP